MAEWLEYGHEIASKGRLHSWGKRVRASIGRVPPHPFVRPAFAEPEAGAIEALQANIVADIEKLMKDRGKPWVVS